MSVTYCIECGAVFANNRSLPDHRRLFGIIKKALPHWPHGDFTPRDEEQLRAFLLLKAGHTNVAFVPAEGIEVDPEVNGAFVKTVKATSAAMAGKGGYVEIQPRSDGANIITPRSIKFLAVSQKDFNPLRDAVVDIIESSLGVPVEQLLRERAA